MTGAYFMMIIPSLEILILIALLGLLTVSGVRPSVFFIAYLMIMRAFQLIIFISKVDRAGKEIEAGEIK